MTDCNMLHTHTKAFHSHYIHTRRSTCVSWHASELVQDFVEVMSTSALGLARGCKSCP